MTPIAIHLRDFTDSDLPIIFEQQADPEAYLMADVPTRDRPAFDEHWARIRSDPSVLLQTIVYEERVAGYLLCWPREAGMPEVGYWLGRDFWGKGVASQAVAIFLNSLSERPLYARVAFHNGASRRVLEKSGFAIIEELPDGWLFRLDTRPA